MTLKLGHRLWSHPTLSFSFSYFVPFADDTGNKIFPATDHSSSLRTISAPSSTLSDPLIFAGGADSKAIHYGRTLLTASHALQKCEIACTWKVDLLMSNQQYRASMNGSLPMTNWEHCEVLFTWWFVHPAERAFQDSLLALAIACAWRKGLWITVDTIESTFFSLSSVVDLTNLVRKNQSLQGALIVSETKSIQKGGWLICYAVLWLSALTLKRKKVIKAMQIFSQQGTLLTFWFLVLFSLFSYSQLSREPVEITSY